MAAPPPPPPTAAPSTSAPPSIAPIPPSAVHRICSGQVVLDLATAVKELVENALDAGATAVEVRLTDSGADLIEVADNGRGIPPAEHASLGRKHHTSKLRSFSDLAAVETFGFRGEALASLCALAESVTVVTRPAGDESGLATRLVFDASGAIVSSDPAARAPGTTVSVKGLFAPLPVRRRELARTLRRDYGRALAVLQAYALARPDVRLVATNTAGSGSGGGRTTAVASAPGATQLATFACLFGPKAAATLVAVDIPLPEDLVPPSGGREAYPSSSSQPPRIVGFVSSGTAERARAAGDRQFYYVNGRPVDWPAASRAVNEAYRSLASPLTAGCRPSVVLDFRLPRAAADVNVTPDKRKVFLAAEARVLGALSDGLARLWEPARSTYTVRTAHTQAPADRRASAAGPGAKRARVEEEAAEEEGEEAGAPSSSPSEEEEEEDEEGDGEATPAPAPAAPARPSTSAARASAAAALRPSLAAFALGGAKPPPAAQATPLTRRTRGRGAGGGGADDGAPTSPAVLSPAARRGGRRAGLAARAAAAKAAAVEEGDAEKEGATPSDDDQTDMSDDQAVVEAEPAAPEPDAAPAGRSPTPPAGGGEEQPRAEEGAPPPPAATARSPTPPAPAPEPAAASLPPAVAAMEVDAAAAPAAARSASPTPPPPAPPTQAPLPPPLVVRVSMADLRARFEARWAALAATKAQKAPEEPTAPTAAAVPAFHAASLAGRGDSPPPEAPPPPADNDGAALPPAPADPTDAAASELERVFDKAEFTALARGVVGQFNLGFILALAPPRPSPPGGNASSAPPGRDLFIIDQHASDEKANFERLGRETVFGRQPLLAPVPLDLAPSEALAVREHADVFSANGFEIVEDEGGGRCDDDGTPCRLLLTAVPTLRGVVFGEADVQELAAELAARPAARTGGAAWPPRPARVRALLASRACRSSIMIGRPLGLGEQRRVVAALAGLDSPWNCPHGRPTMRHLAVLPPGVD